jgi:hypothetical protein
MSKDTRTKSRLPELTRLAILDLLEKSQAFKTLDPKKQQELVEGLTQIAADLASPASEPAASELPGFVSDLINGVFDSNVDKSMKQLNAYVALVSVISQSLFDRGSDEHDGSSQ